jgi:hypothetical protein
VILTSEQHESDRALAADLIDRGRVKSWAQLGAAFQISGQAAHSRFGPKGYGLTMPKRTRQQRRMVSVSLTPKLDSDLERIRTQWPDGKAPTRARIARIVLEQELARYADNVEALA